ncbi:extracellular solute-binding protein, family 5 [Treponema primitia ZAS-2]|uniref:Extracellular solute-binding protein, family 5 n=2 Tax=Treponema primitia TaxID=88058 RepID=F5YLF7_TREPZ|nr:extracellular solute-binding protein, family 5 [Treponema primitia ZAS-2]
MLTGITGCKAKTAAETSSTPTKTELVYVESTDISTMDPRNATGTVTAGILANVFSSLVKTDENGTILPDLAESWKNINDLTWEFKLHDGIKFHDGSQLTAEDVKYTIDTIKDKNNKFRLASDFSFMDVEVVNPLTLNIITDGPFPEILLRLNYVKILPKAYVEKVGNTEFAAKPIGSGPFKFVEWRKDDRVILEANQDYFGKKPIIQKATMRVIPESAARIAALESGEVDIITKVETSQISRLQGSSSYTVTSGPTTRVMYFGINTLKKGPLQDKRVRQALNYAIDKQALITGVLDNFGKQLATISTPEYRGFDPSITPYEYNPAKAKELLAAAGYPNGLNLEISTTSGFLNGSDFVQAFASQLKDVGVNATILEEDGTVRNEKIIKATISDLYFFGFGGPYSSMDNLGKNSFGTGERYSTYNNPEFDALRKGAGAAIDTNEANKLYSQLQAYIKEDAPAIFSHQQYGIYAINTRLKDWKPRTDEMIVINDAHF